MRGAIHKLYCSVHLTPCFPPLRYSNSPCSLFRLQYAPCRPALPRARPLNACLYRIGRAGRTSRASFLHAGSGFEKYIPASASSAAFFGPTPLARLITSALSLNGLWSTIHCATAFEHKVRSFFRDTVLIKRDPAAAAGATAAPLATRRSAEESTACCELAGSSGFKHASRA